MATAEELGFAKPVGTDLIKHGDNAISQNADKAAELIQEAWWDYTEREVLVSTSDIYNLPPKLYRPISPQAATAMDLPSANYGTLEVLPAGPNGKTLVWHPASSDQRFYKNVRVGTTTWTGWKEYRPTKPGASDGVEREMRLAQANARRCGIYGTGDLAVLAMGFDHGTNKFTSEVLPILQEASAPAMLGLNSQMYNPAYIFADTDNNTTFAQLQSMALSNGISIWNHGRLHNGGGEAEIVGGRTELQASLPRLAIENWLHTGTYGDFQSGSSFPKYWENDIGSVIMNSHAYLTGDIQEPIKPLTGHPKPGYDGEWIDNGATPLARVVSLIQKAQQQGGGAVMTRMHPMYLNEPGYITTAQLRDFILWAAAERDAGRLLIITPDLLNVASSAHSYKPSLIPKPASGTGNRAVTLTASDHEMYRGGVFELYVEYSSTKNQSVYAAAKTTGIMQASKATWSLAGKTYILRVPFTIPVGTENLELSVYTGGSSSDPTALSVKEMSLRPA